jgi:3-oxoacyl-[acyl-carrier-protein] synthase II
VLRQQEIPPTANYSRPDPRCDIQVLAGAARPARVSAAMSNSLGFWGYHASLIFTKAL